VLERYQAAGARCLFTTATPIRLDGRGLGAIADVLVNGPTVASLTERGYLVRARVFAPSIPDLTGVHTAGGDFKQDELAGLMDNSRLIGDVVANWLAAGQGRPTVAFCVNRIHSEHLVAKFQAAGVTSVHVDANTPDTERDATWRKLANGQVQVVSSVGIISFGWDVPEVSCALLCRPTQSMALHLQQCGRVLRPHRTKQDAIILDHAGNTLRHGFVDDEREWTLEDKKKRKKSADEELPPDQLPRVCPKCMAVCRPTTKICACGYQFAVIARKPIEETEGTLHEILDKRTYSFAEYTAAAGNDAEDVGVQRIIQNAATRGWKPGAIHFQKAALFEARSRYRAAIGSDPRAHWNVPTLNSIVEMQGRRG
jgi:superfamily II DNA or RNA helicase